MTNGKLSFIIVAASNDRADLNDNRNSDIRDGLPRGEGEGERLFSFSLSIDQFLDYEAQEGPRLFNVMTVISETMIIGPFYYIVIYLVK